MEVAANYDSELDAVVVILNGLLTLDELKTALEVGVSEAARNNCRKYLVDTRETKHKLSLVDFFKLPDIIAETFSLKGLSHHQARTVFLMYKISNDLRFFETVLGNRGYILHLSQSMEDAKTWLKSA